MLVNTSASPMHGGWQINVTLQWAAGLYAWSNICKDFSHSQQRLITSQFCNVKSIVVSATLTLKGILNCTLL